MLDSAAGLLPLDLLATEFADSIDCKKDRNQVRDLENYATLPNLSAHCGAIPSTTTSPTAHFIKPDSFTQVIGYALQPVVLSP